MEKCSQCITCGNVDLDKYGVYCMILHPLPEIKNGRCSSYFKEVKESEIKEDSNIMENKRQLPMMPPDKVFKVDGNEELCYATGYEILDNGEWWNEYEDSNGEYHYGR